MEKVAPTVTSCGPAAWRTEVRATLALAWPLMLANLTQQVIQATDVLLIGRIGPTELAASTLALNLTWTFSCGRRADACTLAFARAARPDTAPALLNVAG